VEFPNDFRKFIKKERRELPSGGVTRQARKKRIWDSLPSVIMGRKGFKILPDNDTKNVIALIVVWEKPNPLHVCVTQLGTPITVTSIDVPLVLVKEKSNTREGLIPIED
jgi:hypothetical protein